jgi:hypothetical protein
MKKFIYFSIGFLVAYLTGTVYAQSDFRGGLDSMSGHYNVDFLPGGNFSTTVDCSAAEGVLKDGGTWPLKVTTVGPVTRALPNNALNVCRSLLLWANRIDGGMPDGG